MSMQIIKSKSNTSAEEVLIENGFTVLSPWADGNRFEKDGQVYKFSHPVWQIGPSGNFVGVRIEKEDKANKIGNIRKLGGHLNAAFLWCKEVIAFASITLR